MLLSRELCKSYPLCNEVTKDVFLVGWYVIDVVTVIRVRVTAGNSRLLVCVCGVCVCVLGGGGYI